ncbi:unnamed protein product [Penicillium pancosmium]
MPKQKKGQLPGISLPIDFVPNTRGNTKMYPTSLDPNHLQNGYARKTIDWVIDELLWRKHRFTKSKIVNVFDGVAKSDTNISPELLQALKDATIPLVKPRQPERMAENEYQVFLDPSLRALPFVTRRLY